MAFVVLKNAKVWIAPADDTPSVPQTTKSEVTGCRSVTIEDTVEVPDTTTFGNDARRYLPGLKNATGSLEVLMDAAANANYSVLKAAFAERRLIIISPYGSGVTGKTFSATEPGYAFNAIITNRPFAQGAVGDAATQTINFQVDGLVVEITSGTV